MVTRICAGASAVADESKRDPSFRARDGEGNERKLRSHFW